MVNLYLGNVINNKIKQFDNRQYFQTTRDVRFIYFYFRV